MSRIDESLALTGRTSEFSSVVVFLQRPPLATRALKRDISVWTRIVVVFACPVTKLTRRLATAMTSDLLGHLWV